MARSGRKRIIQKPDVENGVPPVQRRCVAASRLGRRSGVP